MSVMTPKLKEHLNRMIARFAREIQKREKTSLRRLMALYACCRLAHQKARSDPERAFWRAYLIQLEIRADELKAAELRRKWS